MIDWKNPASLVSENFTVKNCIWLPKWNRLANESDGLRDEIIADLIDTCHMAEDIQEVLGHPIIITSMYRPPKYSTLIGGTSTDVHTRGLAVDFAPVAELSIEDAKALIRPHMQSLNIRMEKGTTNWIHIDSHPPGPSGREFNP